MCPRAHHKNLVLVDVVRYDDGDDDSNDGEDNEGENEANPALLASCSCGIHSFVGVLQTRRSLSQRRKNNTWAARYAPYFDILFHCASRCFNDIDSLVLLLDKNAHLDRNDYSQAP